MPWKVLSSWGASPSLCTGTRDPGASLPHVGPAAAEVGGWGPLCLVHKESVVSRALSHTLPQPLSPALGTGTCTPRWGQRGRASWREPSGAY